jgi:hypothetical protein
MQDALVITALTALVNLDALVGATILTTVFDDPVFKHETYVGVVDEVKLSKRGTFVHFKTDALVGAKWLPLRKVIGFVHAEESKTTAA